MKSKSNLLVVVILFFVSNISFAATASFQGLGHLSGGDFGNYAADCSADGSVVVGSIESDSVVFEAFRWENGVMTGLGGLPPGLPPGGYLLSMAYGVSSDGSVVVGDSVSADGLVVEAFRWENGIMVGLGDLPGGDFSSSAAGVSADGSVIVGESSSDSGYEAFRWENGVMTGLGFLPHQGGFKSSQALAVSSDGLVVVGWGRSLGGEGKEAFRWTEETGMVGLGYLPGGDFDSRARGVSADGSVVVGYGTSDLGIEAFRWENGQMIGLGDLPGGDFWSEASDVSADGSVIVGHSRWSEFEWDAFIWDADNGMRNLQDVLANDCGLDLTGWTLGSANGISADGMTIVGSGYGPNGPEGWIATIPEPTTLLLLGLGGILIRKRRREF